MHFAFHKLCDHFVFIRVVGFEHLRIVVFSRRFRDTLDLLTNHICLDCSKGNRFPPTVIKSDLMVFFASEYTDA